MNLIVVRNSCEFRYGATFVGPLSALTLLVAGIALANDKHDAPAADDLALLANAFYAGADLHDNRLTLSLALGWSKANQYKVSTPSSSSPSEQFLRSGHWRELGRS